MTGNRKCSTLAATEDAKKAEADYKDALRDERKEKARVRELENNSKMYGKVTQDILMEIQRKLEKYHNIHPHLLTMVVQWKAITAGDS